MFHLFANVIKTSFPLFEKSQKVCQYSQTQLYINQFRQVPLQVTQLLMWE